MVAVAERLTSADLVTVAPAVSMAVIDGVTSAFLVRVAAAVRSAVAESEKSPVHAVLTPGASDPMNHT